MPTHDPTDYCQWETVNFTRLAHARLLYDFLEQPVADRYKDNVLAEDYGYHAAPISLPPGDRERLNKDLMHFTYDRLRHTPATKPWPDSLLSSLHDPVVAFMRRVEPQADLFPTPELAQFWRDLIGVMESGRQLIISGRFHSGGALVYHVNAGRLLPSGKAELTKFGQPL